MKSDESDFRKIGKATYFVGKGLVSLGRVANDIIESGLNGVDALENALIDKVCDKVGNVSKSKHKPGHLKDKEDRAAIEGLGRVKWLFDPIFVTIKDRGTKGIEISKSSGIVKKVTDFAKNLTRKERDMVLNGLVVSALIIPLAAAPLFTHATKSVERSKEKKGIVRTADQKRLSSRGNERIEPPAVPAPTPPPAPVPPARDPNLPPVLAQKTASIDLVLLRRFDAFRTYIFQQYGVVLEIKSGYRSTAEQAYLFRTLPPGRANPPGVSLHEKGRAIDYTNFSPTYNQHLHMFGLKLPFPGRENWHIEAI